MRRRLRVSNGLNRTGRLQTAVFLEGRVCYQWKTGKTGLTGLSGKRATPLLLIFLTLPCGSETSTEKYNKKIVVSGMLEICISTLVIPND